MKRANTLLIRFEDIVRGSEAVIESLAAFLNRRPVRSIATTFKDLHKILPDFFRSGDNRRNIQELTPSQLALFDSIHAATMQELGYYS